MSVSPGSLWRDDRVGRRLSSGGTKPECGGAGNGAVA